jgi:hypothetical protein
MNKQLLREFIRQSLREAPEIVSLPRTFTPAILRGLPGSTDSIPGLVRSGRFIDQDGSAQSFVDNYVQSSHSNDGEKFEDGLVAYARSLGNSAERIGGRGIDVEVGNRTYEIKKSQGKAPNMMFNSSFPKGDENHFYLFVTNAPKSSNNASVNTIENMNVLAVPGKELRRIIFQSMFSEMENMGAGIVYDGDTVEILPDGEKKIQQLIKNKLEKMDLPQRIADKLGDVKLIPDIAGDQLELPFDASATKTIELKDPVTHLDFGLLKVRIRLMIEPKVRLK